MTVQSERFSESETLTVSNPGTGGSVRDILSRAEAQKVLFSDKLNWADLIGVDLAGGQKRRISVLRNHAFETVGGLIRQFARFGGWEPVFSLSDYDDSLSFDADAEADLILLWLDISRYKMEPGELADWLASRVDNIRKSSAAPLVAAVWTADGDASEKVSDALKNMAGVYFADLRAAIADATGRCVEDARMRAVGGTPLGREQQAVIAREAGCRWLPAALLPPLKAVALDLDGTLHDGVLGEDGVGGVKLSDSLKKFQRSLKALKERGVFLALVSRNEESDVRELFERRGDYPLRWDDFSAHRIGWEDKAAGVAFIAEKLRIGVDAVLMADDNPGELAAIHSALADVKLLWASPDVSNVNRALDYYPGLWRHEAMREDSLRTRDLSAGAGRAEILAQSESEDDYFRALGICLSFHVNPAPQLKRLADLSRKTNQFNLALCRLGEAQVSGIIGCPQSDAVAVDLSDRLSESGVIAFVAAALEGETLFVKEVCISCRALGRRLENAIVLRAVKMMTNYARCRSVAFNFSTGPRNAPALQWLEKLIQYPPPESGVAVIEKDKMEKHKFSEAIEFRDI